MDTIPKRKIFFIKDNLDEEIDLQNNKEEEIKCPDIEIDDKLQNKIIAFNELFKIFHQTNK